MQGSLTLEAGPSRLLVIDTCLHGCQAAVLCGDEPLAVVSEAMARGHQERIGNVSRQAMADAGLTYGDLDQIAVSVGPGSFTGLRVGLAFAKGLALALKRPCVGVGTLEALAAGLQDSTATLAVIDAGRGRAYVQAFSDAKPVTEPEVLEISMAQSRFQGRLPVGPETIVGPGAHLLAEVWPGARLAHRPFADAIAIGRLSLRGARGPARPIYLRPPDAIPRADKRV